MCETLEKVFHTKLIEMPEPVCKCGCCLSDSLSTTTVHVNHRRKWNCLRRPRRANPSRDRLRDFCTCTAVKWTAGVVLAAPFWQTTSPCCRATTTRPKKGFRPRTGRRPGSRRTCPPCLRCTVQK